jgi:histidinol-phosphate aminotransferase
MGGMMSIVNFPLANNENALGPSPMAHAAALTALASPHLYPDSAYLELKQTLAAFLQVEPQQLTIGNGSENVLELIVKAALHSGGNAVISQYTFLTIPLLIKSYGAMAKVVPAQNWGHDIAAMVAAIDEKTRVLFLVNPNNPTGSYTTVQDFLWLMEAVPTHVLVVVDEAYYEYMSAADYPYTLAYLARYPNLVITRTFSKIYGLAALRIGYGISSLEVANRLEAVRLPYNVNAVAAKAACAALQDQAHVAQSTAMTCAGRQQLIAGLQQTELMYLPSVGNFITVRVGDAKRCYQQLLQGGVMVRALDAYAMPEYIRVTVGTAEQNSRFLALLADLALTGPWSTLQPAARLL